MKLKYIIGSFLLASILSACDLMGNIDNIQPQNQLEQDNYITTPKSAEQALNGIYQSWRTWGIAAFRAHQSVLSGGINSSNQIADIEGFSTCSVSPNNNAVLEYYSLLYSVINAANYLIAALEDHKAIGIDSTRNVEIIGECKFHRAMAHFMLLRQFGQFYDESSDLGIVLRKEPYYPGTPISGRDKVADCYTFILQDLTAADTTAPEMSTSGARISRLTAKALQARVLLYKKDYPAAANMAQEVLDEAENSGYELETGDWTQLFIQSYTNPENLFAIYTQGYAESCPIAIEGIGTSSYTEKLSNLWAKKTEILEADPRFVLTFLNDDSDTGNGKYPYSSYDWDNADGYIFIRLAEVYLIHAEAEARQGTSHYAAARASLKTITDRAGYPEDLVENIAGEDLLEAIRAHKWLELVIENGEEWFDIVRYTKAGNLALGEVQTNLKSEWQFILPIPEKALSGNKLLVQNPKY